MDIVTARAWIIRTSLIITGLSFGFFLLSPALGYPLTFGQATRLLEIVIPVFLGYLGSATYYLFGQRTQRATVRVRGSRQLFNLLVKGPLYLFGAAVAFAIAAFGISNRAEASPGDGLSVDALAGVISLALGLLAVTTNVVVAYLFSTGDRNEHPETS